jgi:adenylylsulfate kinase
MIILIMGLPGAGKTHLAERLRVCLDCAHYNADQLRGMANDWDFSESGRIRQSERMNTLALFEGTRGRTAIFDFVCPTEETRKRFSADIVIWVDSIEHSRYDDTNSLFEPPPNAHYHIKVHLSEAGIRSLALELTAKETLNV